MDAGVRHSAVRMRYKLGIWMDSNKMIKIKGSCNSLDSDI